MDELLDEPEAYTLYKMFMRWHHSKPFFAIAPRAMSEAGSPPWSRHKIIKARDVLLERGYLEELIAPKKGSHPGQYRLARNARSGHNHNTPFSLVD